MTRLTILFGPAVAVDLYSEASNERTFFFPSKKLSKREAVEEAIGKPSHERRQQCAAERTQNVQHVPGCVMFDVMPTSGDCAERVGAIKRCRRWKIGRIIRRRTAKVRKKKR